MKSLKTLLSTLFFALTATSFAANIIPNNEGISLYYIFNEENKLATLQPSEGETYRGIINIPEQVTFEGTTYVIDGYGFETKVPDFQLKEGDNVFYLKVASDDITDSARLYLEFREGTL